MASPGSNPTRPCLPTTSRSATTRPASSFGARRSPTPWCANNVAIDNQLGIFIRHARHITVTGNHIRGNCQGILVLDDGEPGGAGNTIIKGNSVNRNNKFCPNTEDTPSLQGGGILLLGATHTLVAGNSVAGNTGN